MECIGRKEQTDKNGRNYVRLFFINWAFQLRTDPTSGEVVFVKEHSHVGHSNQYPETYTSSGRPDPYYRMQVGDMVTGAVIQRKVKPYKTAKGFEIDYYNAVVFGDSTKSDWEARIRREFEKNGYSLMPDYTHEKFDIAEEKAGVKQVKAADRAAIVANLKNDEEKLNF